MPPPDLTSAETGIARDLRGVASRLRAREAVRAVALWLVLAGSARLILGFTGISRVAAGAISIVVLVVGAACWMYARRLRWTAVAAARALEHAHPQSRNLIVTAEELLRWPLRARPAIRSRVLLQAHDIARQVPVSDAVPVRRDAAIAGIALLGAVLIAIGAPQRAATVLRDAVVAATSRSDAHATHVVATVSPPAYTGEPTRTLENPERIEAVEGSHLTIALSGGGGWRARFGSDPIDLVAEASLWRANLVLSASGYLVLDPQDADATKGRQLIPVAVTPDKAPTIRIDAPAKDMLLPDAKPTVPLTATATDDFGMQSLDLRYTKVSGSGEQFEFKEGSIPLQIDRTSERAWSARAGLALSTLALEPGDSLIYRVVGRDRRPGDAGLASSDTFFVEIAGPGQVALEGFELPPDRDRYALSQQMIVIKLERLRARERTMDRAAVEAEVAGIAAEQRAVRANFIFLTGGTVEDEEEEAAHSHEIQEGRLENTARQEIMRAIQFMGGAEQGLAAVNTAAALPPAKSAVEALQRAFGRNRYFLRALPVRSRVDPSRRLTGELSSAADWRRELFPAEEDEPTAKARTLLARLVELSGEIEAGSLPADAMAALAEQAISIDPASSDWQAIARNLTTLRDERGGDSVRRGRLLSDAVSAVAAVVKRHSPAIGPADGGSRALRGAWDDEQRKRSGGAR